MKVAKEFRWEGAHRLPWHEGGCANLHGHSYRMTVELEGEPDARGMLLDFKILKQLVKPLVDAWDHATLIAEYDEVLQEAVDLLDSKKYILPFDTTSENLCRYVAEYLNREGGEVLRTHGITNISVSIRETETCYATLESRIEKPVAVPV